MDLEAYTTVSEPGRAIENHVFYDFFFFAYSPYLEMRLDSMSKVICLSGIENKTSIQVA